MTAKRTKLMTIIGTRPDTIKLSEIIKKCDSYFDHVLVHTGQNYSDSLNEIFFEDLNLRKPDIYLDAAGNNLGETIGNVISKSYDIIGIEKPDGILILGDTNSSLAAISAKRHKVPIFHMEAGNRCFDENLPEEINRRIVDHISDVNMPYSEHARRYLLDEGIAKDRIYVTGSPMREVLNAHKKKIEGSTIINELGLSKSKYIILSAHREENLDNERNFDSLMNGINDLAEEYDMPIIYSLHPRSEKRINDKGFSFKPNVKKMTPFSFSDYVNLQKNAFCVVSDSGTLAEEASIMKFPAVSIRTSTERPEAFEQGNFILGGITGEEIINAVKIVTEREGNGRTGGDVSVYENNNVSDLIVNIISSYIPIVNDRVWRK